MGVCVVIRDEEWEVQVSLCMPMDQIQSTVVVEITALSRALRLCAQLNVDNAIFERDALSVVKAVNSAKENWEWYGQLVEDIKGFQCKKSSWTVEYIYKEGNRVAQFLAKFAFNVNEKQVWIEDGPKGCFSFVIQDKLCID